MARVIENKYIVYKIVHIINNANISPTVRSYVLRRYRDTHCATNISDTFDNLNER